MADEDDNEIGAEEPEEAAGASPLTGHNTPTNNSFPGNSYRERSKAAPQSKAPNPEVPEKKITKVIDGEVIQRKKPLGRKIVEIFTVENTKDVGEYIVLDVLVPGLRDLVFDVLTRGIERKFYGDSRGRRIPTGAVQAGQTAMRVAYNKMASPSRAGAPDGPNVSKQARTASDFAEVILADRGEAEQVLDTMVELVANYGRASVYELYELVGITGNFAEQSWGWDDLRASRIDRVREGYLVNLPKPKPID